MSEPNAPQPQQGIPIEVLLQAMKDYGLEELKLGEFYARRGVQTPAVNVDELKKFYSKFNETVSDEEILMNPMKGLEGLNNG